MGVSIGSNCGRMEAPGNRIAQSTAGLTWRPHVRGHLSSIQLAAPRTTGWTVAQRAGYCFAMARRSVIDPLEPTKELRWYTVRNMHGALLEARLLPAGSNLKRALVAAMLEWIDAGWDLGEFGSRGGTFFCTRGAERRMVCITPSDPGEVKNCF
jgi:uncharacterized protein YqcC (DUF446 family)